MSFLSLTLVSVWLEYSVQPLLIPPLTIGGRSAVLVIFLFSLAPGACGTIELSQ
jgi:hypothetical protein